MTTIPSKEQVDELSAEQQEIIGRIALDEARSHRQTLAQARCYREHWVVPALMWVAGFCLWTWLEDLSILVILLFFGTLLYINLQARSINSRIDALIKLSKLGSFPEPSNKEAESGRNGD